MSYWLFKTDPETYSYHDLEKEVTTIWDGVKNPLALKHLKNCKKGDQVFIYHTGDEKAIVGLAEVVKAEGENVHIRAKGRLKKPVSLWEVKGRREFSDFALVRMPRLSVMPVTDAQWEALMKLGG